MCSIAHAKLRENTKLTIWKFLVCKKILFFVVTYLKLFHHFFQFYFWHFIFYFLSGQFSLHLVLVMIHKTFLFSIQNQKLFLHQQGVAKKWKGQFSVILFGFCKIEDFSSNIFLPQGSSFLLTDMEPTVKLYLYLGVMTNFVSTFFVVCYYYNLFCPIFQNSTFCPTNVCQTCSLRYADKRFRMRNDKMKNEKWKKGKK